MSKSKLLQEAIADAKAVKETALLNAKAALTEAFTPKLQSMISAKLQQEMDDEDMEGAEDEEMYEEDEMEDETDVEDLTTEEDEMDSEEDIYTEEDEMDSEDEFSDEQDLELEAIIRELEDEEMESDEETNEELDSSEIGDDDDTEPTVDTDTENDDDLVAEEDEDEESEIDINEIIRALREDDSFMGDGTPDGDADEESQEEEAMAENKKLRKDLVEAYRVIKQMKTTINETNLLNAKLLFSNKLFKSYDLNESQKLKVIDNFDRANTLREVKLVYTTLAESMKTPAKRRVNESASRVTGSTAPKKQVLNEGDNFKARLQKLAGLKK